MIQSLGLELSNWANCQSLIRDLRGKPLRRQVEGIQTSQAWGEGKSNMPQARAVREQIWPRFTNLPLALGPRKCPQMGGAHLDVAQGATAPKCSGLKQSGHSAYRSATCGCGMVLLYETAWA